MGLGAFGGAFRLTAPDVEALPGPIPNLGQTAADGLVFLQLPNVFKCRFNVSPRSVLITGVVGRQENWIFGAAGGPGSPIKAGQWLSRVLGLRFFSTLCISAGLISWFGILPG